MSHQITHPEPGARRLELGVLGPLRLEGSPPEGPASVLRQPKRVALLTYLALEAPGTYVRRDRLLTLFWPESTSSRARATLRQAVSFLRTQLGDQLLPNRGREEIGLSTEHLSCDAWRFTACARDDDPAGALELYRGDLLEGFLLDGTYEFQEWLDDRRVGMRHQAGQMSWRMARNAEARRNPGEASFWAKRALSYSPFNELEVRRLMQFLDRVGDRAGALRAYRGLAEALRRDYGAQPSPETEALMKQVKERLGPADAETEQGGDVVLGRRSGRERRSGRDRRVATAAAWKGRERRSGLPRRTRIRRSGVDRRDPLV